MPDDKVLVTKSKLDSLADMISAKSGEPVTMTIDEMTSAVESIKTDFLLQEKTVTPIQSNYSQIITPDNGVVSGSGNIFDSRWIEWISSTPMSDGVYKINGTITISDLEEAESTIIFNDTELSCLNGIEDCITDFTITGDIASQNLPTSIKIQFHHYYNNEELGYLYITGFGNNILINDYDLTFSYDDTYIVVSLEESEGGGDMM